MFAVVIIIIIIFFEDGPLNDGGINKDVIGSIPPVPPNRSWSSLTFHAPSLSHLAASPDPPKLGGPIHKLFPSN